MVESAPLLEALHDKLVERLEYGGFARRECFVGITRAHTSLTLTYSASYFGWPKEPSRFLSEMGFGLDGVALMRVREGDCDGVAPAHNC